MSFMGSLQGNFLGILYYLLFQLLGIYCVLRLMAKKESRGFILLLGSVVGSVSLQWLPIITAAMVGFTRTGHILALILMVTITLFIHLGTQTSYSHVSAYAKRMSLVEFSKENQVIWLILITFAYYVYLLYTHTLFTKNGAYYTGQATYGDMHMHLGFITSIATQGTFPPEYSILPGTKLSYPFLCDSISSSLYVFGASLKVAYKMPMYIAFLQVLCGFYCFIKEWLQSSKKALVAWILFFWNGGLGFIYFLDIDKFKRIFTDFYYTPTSLGDENIRWAQIIVNMLVPQRATLFGWAVLFPLLWLLYKAIKTRNTKYFILSGVLGSSLVMIHTHSFMALGLICTMWLFFDLKNVPAEKDCNKPTKKLSKKLSNTYLPSVFGESPLLRSFVIGLSLLFSLLQIINFNTGLIDTYGILIMGIGIGLLILYLLILLWSRIQYKEYRSILTTWGVFLLIIILLALPQLFTWTFQQSSGDGFIRAHFNWSNTSDQYLWFYIKNIGVAALLFIPAWMISKKQTLEIASPLLLIWFIAELTVFQPNVYDNNKLLFIGYVFVCGIVANFIVDTCKKIKNKLILYVTLFLLFFFSTISAFLTMGREYISEYEVYSADQLALSNYIEQQVAPDAVIMTDTRHNNAVAALTGRNIVCGAGTYLYYHGLDYGQPESDLVFLYEKPYETKDLLEQYHVDYILVGPDERRSYDLLDEEAIRSLYECVFEVNDVALYKVH